MTEVVIGFVHETVDNDREALERLNKEIGDLETAGNRDRLAEIMAPELAFQRADPKRTIDNRERYLEKVKANDPRATEVESISYYGNRAVVSCIVTVTSQAGVKRYHNLRIFIRHDHQWKLLGWANEPLP